LTGGGSSGAVTLNLNTALVPTLAGANTFTATNAFTGSVGVGTTTPGQKLDVAGSINMAGSLLYQEVAVLAIPGGVIQANTALGVNALASTSGGYNTATGYLALGSNAGGFYNTASGAYALAGNIGGLYNTAHGYGALMSNVSGSGSVAIGYDALSNSTATGTASNTAVGYQALQGGSTPSLDVGAGNTATGYQAMQLNTGGGYNTAHGFRALQSNTTGGPNTAFGAFALHSNTTGSDNSAAGYEALNANTIGHDNSASGFQALLANVSGNQNTASGSFALTNNISDNDNTAVGFQALSSNNGGGSATQNTAVGSGALQQNTAASQNTAVGSGALQQNTLSAGNTALGYQALQNASSFATAPQVYGNTAVGYQALQGGLVVSANNGYANTAIGNQALLNNTGGIYNIAIGAGAAGNVSGGNSGNIHIGNPGTPTDSSTIKIGCPETGTGIYGCTAQTSFFAQGIYGAGSGGSAVTINASGQLVAPMSSRRYKEDIHDMNETSRGLMDLRPVTFHYKRAAADGSKPLQYGLIAEEVAEVYPELVVYNKAGLPDAVQYQVLPAMLLNEVQRQQAEIRRLEERLAKLEALLSSTSAASVVPAGR
jgi:hypothetical protein